MALGAEVSGRGTCACKRYQLMLISVSTLVDHWKLLGYLSRISPPPLCDECLPSGGPTVGALEGAPLGTKPSGPLPQTLTDPVLINPTSQSHTVLPFCTFWPQLCKAAEFRPGDRLIDWKRKLPFPLPPSFPPSLSKTPASRAIQRPVLTSTEGRPALSRRVVLFCSCSLVWVSFDLPVSASAWTQSFKFHMRG